MATPNGCNVITGGNRSTRRKPVMFGRVKLDNTLFTYDQGNFNQITAWNRSRVLATVMRDTCTTTVLLALFPPPKDLLHGLRCLLGR